jgi:hypothetical protein
MQPQVAKPGTSSCKVLQTDSQGRLIVTPVSIAITRAVYSYQPTGMALTHFIGYPEELNQLPLACRLYSFFAMTS